MKITESQLKQMVKEELAGQKAEYNKRMLEEGILDIFKRIGKGGIENIKEGIAKRMLTALDIATDTSMAKVFINFVGNLSLSDIKNMLMGDNKCLTATGELSQAIAETLIEEIPVAMGIEVSGFFGGALREALSGALGERFAKQMAVNLCKIDYTDILKTIPGGSMLAKFF